MSFIDITRYIYITVFYNKINVIPTGLGLNQLRVKTTSGILFKYIKTLHYWAIICTPTKTR